MALRAEIVDFVRLEFMQDRRKRATVREVGVMEKEPIIGFMEILKNMIDTIGIETRSTALEAMNFIAFFEEKLGQIRAVLTCATGDQSLFHWLNIIPQS